MRNILKNYFSNWTQKKIEISLNSRKTTRLESKHLPTFQHLGLEINKIRVEMAFQGKFVRWLCSPYKSRVRPWSFVRHR
jgi:hypothetical protein